MEGHRGGREAGDPAGRRSWDTQQAGWEGGGLPGVGGQAHGKPCRGGAFGGAAGRLLLALTLAVAFTVQTSEALPTPSAGLRIQAGLVLRGMPRAGGWASAMGGGAVRMGVVAPLRGGALLSDSASDMKASANARRRKALAFRVVLVAVKCLVGACGLLWFHGCAMGLWNVARAVMLPGGLEWMEEQSSHGLIGVGVFVLFTSGLLFVQVYKLWSLAVATSFSEVRRSFLWLAIFNVFFVYMVSWRTSPGLQDMTGRDLAILGEAFCMVFVVVLLWLKQPWRGHGRKMSGGKNVSAGKRPATKLKNR